MGKEMNYAELKEAYDKLLIDTHQLGMFKYRIGKLEKELERLNRVVNLRDKEIIELSYLVSEAIKWKVKNN